MTAPSPRGLQVHFDPLPTRGQHTISFPTCRASWNPPTRRIMNIGAESTTFLPEGHLLVTFCSGFSTTNRPLVGFSTTNRPLMNGPRRCREDRGKNSNLMTKKTMTKKIVKLSNCQIVKLSNCQIVKSQKKKVKKVKKTL